MTTVNAVSRASARELQVHLRKGLNIAIAGSPRQIIEPAHAPTSVALVGDDYVGLRPKLLVQQGDRVRLGDPLLADRRDARIVFTAFGSGTVAAINLGERRSLRSVVLSLDGEDEGVTFPAHSPAALASLPPDTVIETLLRSGSWTALRSRPFGSIPLPDAVPQAIFVTAMDTNPLAARPEAVIADHRDDFAHGLTIVSRIAECPIFLCTAPGAGIANNDTDRITQVAFAGPHPAGLPGTHIHILMPAGLGHESWHIGYQDVIAIGRLFTTGRLWTERVVALTGPPVRQPRIVRTRLGADVSELVAGELAAGPVRVVSGSVLSGRQAIPPVGYLGRYHLQVSVLGEPVSGARPLRPSFSMAGIGRLFRGRPVAMSTALNGEPEAMLPLGSFERVMPLDILPTPLLRALALGDSERALDLGCLELEEEDLALCTFVCPSKLDYGALLRRTLTQIEKEL
ncbi:MAG: Na(+)-translocating NADH-quinone reductase subunit A [Aestuariivirga sp.]|nr:Na(+)-translocating NADH-quinone reductase subunit A [Aestuariivirga sp.]